MAHDVFLSHSKNDAKVAIAICAALEASNARCWIAPRDVGPGREWPAEILDAVSNSKVMVLVFSAHANGSRQVMREVERAVHHGVIIIPFRLEDVPFSKSLEYLVGASHWLDAITPPLREQIDRLVNAVKNLLNDRNLNSHASQTIPVPPIASATISGQTSTPPLTSELRFDGRGNFVSDPFRITGRKVILRFSVSGAGRAGSYSVLKLEKEHDPEDRGVFGGNLSICTNGESEAGDERIVNRLSNEDYYLTVITGLQWKAAIVPSDA